MTELPGRRGFSPAAQRNFDDLKKRLSTIEDSGVAPSGAAGGQLSGTYPDPNLATSVAGNGLAGGGGTALSVNVDGTTIEINADALRVKDGGISNAKLSDATLLALAAFNTNGLLTQTAADTFTARTLTGDTEIVVANGSGVAGNPTLSIAAAIARLASPTFTGTPAAPTASPGTNTTQLSTTAFVTAAIAALSLGTISTQNANNVSITGGSITGITDLAVADGGTGASTAANARTNLGLGSISTQDSNNVSVTGGSITGITDLAVADGGTAASTASGARTNLGLVIGTDVAAIGSPAFTGNPTAPTPSSSDNDTSIATTAFVQGVAVAAQEGLTFTFDCEVMVGGGEITTQAPAGQVQVIHSGNTLTNVANGAITTFTQFTQPGGLVASSLVLNDVVLVNTSNSGGNDYYMNGIWYITTLGDASHPFVLTRYPDFDTAAELRLGRTTKITSGTYTGRVWTIRTAPTTINASPVSYTELTSNPSGPAGGALTGGYPDPTLGTAAFAIPAATINAGDAAAAGSATTAMRSDAQMAVSTASTSATQSGTAAEGTATSLARSDHVHAAIGDAGLSSPNNSTYKTIFFSNTGVITDAVAGTYILSDSNNIVAGTSANVHMFRFTAADFAVAGLTTKLRIRAQCAVNATGTGTMTFIVGLYPLTVAGGADAIVYTHGTVVPGSTVTFTTPTASTITDANSGDLTIPSDGPFGLAVVTNQTLANNSRVQIHAQVQVRNV